MKIKMWIVLVMAVQQVACSGVSGEHQFDADGSVICFDKFNPQVGEVGVERRKNTASGNTHVIFSYRGEGIYAPGIRLGKKGRGVVKSDYNLVHLRFRVDAESEPLLQNMNLRLQRENDPNCSASLHIFDFVSDEKDEEGYYNSFIPLEYFNFPFDIITHAYPFCNTYGSRNTHMNMDFDLAAFDFKRVDELDPYQPNFRREIEFDADMDKRVAMIQRAKFSGDITKSRGNDTREGVGFSGPELFALQQELRQLVHENLNRAPSDRELEIISLLRYGDLEREVSWKEERATRLKQAAKSKGTRPILFYDGYAIYKNVVRYRATGDQRYLDIAMLQSDFLMNHYRGEKTGQEYVDDLVANNGTLGLGRGFSGICELIVEIMATPELQGNPAPAMTDKSITWLEQATEWMPLMMRVFDGHLAKGKYENGKWLEGDGKAINRFLYFTHFLAAASQAGTAVDASRYAAEVKQAERLTKEILTFFQGDCLFTDKTLSATKRESMEWDAQQNTFVCEYGPYVIWAYAHDRENTEDRWHITMDVDAIDNLLSIDSSLLSEEFKKRMTTMLFIATFNIQTGGIPRDIGPNAPGRDPELRGSVAPLYGRYVGKYGVDAMYQAFIDYQLKAWDTRLSQGKLGRLRDNSMPREIVEARLFRYQPDAVFPHGF